MKTIFLMNLMKKAAVKTRNRKKAINLMNLREGMELEDIEYRK